jgi:hypothetical protein
MEIIRWPIWYKIISLIFVVCFFIYHFKSHSDLINEKYNRDVMKNIDGIILDKFIDNQNHMHKTCLIKGDDTIKFIFDTDKSGVFNFLNIGDSIRKPIGDSTIIVKRDKILSRFTLKY